MLLLDSFQKFNDQDYRHMAISAQSAVEILSYIFFKKQLKASNISSARVDDFLSNRATFSSQLFTLLPLLSNTLGFEMLNDKVIDGLKLLVKYRNDMIHRGKTKIQIDKSQSIIMLMSSFFSVKYFQIIHGINPV